MEQQPFTAPVRAHHHHHQQQQQQQHQQIDLLINTIYNTHSIPLPQKHAHAP